MRLPDARQLKAKVAFAPDGKVASSDLAVDFHDARRVMLMRARGDKGVHGSTALFEMDPDKEGLVNVQSSGGAKGTVTFTRDGIGVMCGETDGVYKLNGLPLYKILADLTTVKKTRLSCLDTKDMLAKHDLDVGIDGSMIRIGDVAYDAALAANEVLTIADNGESIAFIAVMPDKHAITLMFDGAGKLKTLMGMTENEATYSCEART